MARKSYMSIPIIFFHYGNPKYLKYSLKQARYFNPDSAIYLLGDESNDRYPFVTHINANDFEGSTHEFAKMYKHLSPNGEKYELNCFLRWFYVKTFCEKNNIESFIYLDSDVLLFQDVSKLVPLFKDYKIANTCDTMGVPAFTYFKDHKSISDFCDFLIYAYTDKAMMAKLEDLYKTILSTPEILDAISDMTLFHLYFQEHPAETVKIDLINNEIAIDACINRQDGYEVENGMKKVYWQNNLPYCKHLESDTLIRFAAIHYQGYSKDLMRKHYKAGGYTIPIFWEELDLKARFRKSRRAVKSSIKQFFKK